MRLRRLEIERFRGIGKLDWRHIGRTAALVGPGDSGKSTILDAIERLLSPRWSVPFDDTDFWNLETHKPIVLRATLTDLPNDFYRDTKFGLALRGFDPKKGEAGEATGADGELHALVVQLRVDASLEPVWSVIDGEGQTHSILARDRETLGMLRVGAFLDQHLGWSRGSVLTRLTESGDAVGAVLAEATRQARAGLKRDGLDRLNEAATTVETIGRHVGVAPKAKFVARLDAASLSVAAGALSLHDGDVPVRRAGLGTRRLLAVAMQRQASADSGLTLVDEFEHGLEPHRIRRLLRMLRGKAPEDEAEVVHGQLVLTTHSPAVLSELSADEVLITRMAADGVVSVKCVPDAVAYLLPRTPEALLAQKVLVAEGATEEGFCIALDDAWTDESNGASFAYRGVALVDARGGTQPAEVAGYLDSLGYATAVLVDSDATAKTSRAGAATILTWAGRMSTEERVATDLPLEGVREMTRLAAASTKAGHPRRVRDCLADAVKIKREDLGVEDPGSWIDAVGDQGVFRTELGKSAKRNGWFKTRSLGRQLGALIIEHWTSIKSTQTGRTVQKLRSFVHDD